ncbi:MAG: ribosome silencing factor [Planctomycetaceae bacterium]
MRGESTIPGDPSIGELKHDAGRMQQRARGLETARICARVADELRGRETLILDLTRLTPIIDFFVITTGASGRQMHAIADEINRVLKAAGHRRLGREGVESNSWILLDFGDVVVHVFNEDARAKYDLEHLWADAGLIDWKGNDECRNQNVEGMTKSE